MATSTRNATYTPTNVASKNKNTAPNTQPTVPTLSDTATEPASSTNPGPRTSPAACCWDNAVARLAHHEQRHAQGDDKKRHECCHQQGRAVSQPAERTVVQTAQLVRAARRQQHGRAAQKGVRTPHEALRHAMHREIKSQHEKSHGNGNDKVPERTGAWPPPGARTPRAIETAPEAPGQASAPSRSSLAERQSGSLPSRWLAERSHSLPQPRS